MHPPKKAQLEERRVSPEVRGEARWPLVSAAVVRRRASGCARVPSSMQALPAPHDTGTGSILPRCQRSATPGDDMAHLQSVSTKAEALRAEIVRVTIEFRPVICFLTASSLATAMECAGCLQGLEISVREMSFKAGGLGCRLYPSALAQSVPSPGAPALSLPPSPPHGSVVLGSVRATDGVSGWSVRARSFGESVCSS